MAKNNNNIVINNISGSIGKQIVIKKFKAGTIVTKFPDMSNIIPTEEQKKKRTKFADAVAFAKQINNNPAEHKKWKKDYPNAMSVFQAAISWYMKNE